MQTQNPRSLDVAYPHIVSSRMSRSQCHERACAPRYSGLMEVHSNRLGVIDRDLSEVGEHQLRHHRCPAIRSTARMSVQPRSLGSRVLRSSARTCTGRGNRCRHACAGSDRRLPPSSLSSGGEAQPRTRRRYAPVIRRRDCRGPVAARRGGVHKLGRLNEASM